MLQSWSYAIVALGAFYLNSAFGQPATSTSLGVNGTGETRLGAEPGPRETKESRRGRHPPGGNPLWGVPIDQLTATRERPLFTVSRRPPSPPAAPKPPADAPPPPPAEPERPHLTLLGTVTGEPQKVAGFRTKRQRVSFASISAKRFWVVFAFDRYTKRDGRKKWRGCHRGSAGPRINARQTGRGLRNCAAQAGVLSQLQASGIAVWGNRERAAGLACQPSARTGGGNFVRGPSRN
jgi:hypothetical protein